MGCGIEERNMMKEDNGCRKAQKGDILQGQEKDGDGCLGCHIAEHRLRQDNCNGTAGGEYGGNMRKRRLS